MPMLTVEMFDSPPSVGDKVEVSGTIQKIDDQGNVEVSYDEVTNHGKEDSQSQDGMKADESLENYMKSRMDSKMPKGDTQ